MNKINPPAGGKTGYTLIEILVVISIIGFIAAAAMYFLNSAREEGRIAGILQFSGGVKSSLADNTVSYWSFNNGDATDSWGQNHGSLVNLDSSDVVEGVIGGAFDFNGSNEYIIVPASSGDLDIKPPNPVTMAAWIKPSSFGGWRQIIGRGGGEGYYGLNLNDAGNLNGGLHGCSNFNGSSILSTNKWHHVVGVMNGASSKLYLDGVEDGSGTITNDCGGSGNYVSIGARYDASAQWYFQGMIDEVQIYGEALSFTQIQKLYAEGAKKFQVAIK